MSEPFNKIYNFDPVNGVIGGSPESSERMVLRFSSVFLFLRFAKNIRTPTGTATKIPAAIGMPMIPAMPNGKAIKYA